MKPNVGKVLTVLLIAVLVALLGMFIQSVPLFFLGRALPAGELRWKFLLLSPLAISPAAFILFDSRAWDKGIWENELWLAKAYGPLLVVAAIATLSLLAAVRYDHKSRRQGD